MSFKMGNYLLKILHSKLQFWKPVPYFIEQAFH